jgi:hypothetical protein
MRTDASISTNRIAGTDGMRRLAHLVSVKLINALDEVQRRKQP